jgi:hypothetical protein
VGAMGSVCMDQWTLSFVLEALSAPARFGLCRLNSQISCTSIAKSSTLYIAHFLSEFT